jgi:quercetin dioxygenase-like cupin family protein
LKSTVWLGPTRYRASLWLFGHNWRVLAANWSHQRPNEKAREHELATRTAIINGDSNHPHIERRKEREMTQLEKVLYTAKIHATHTSAGGTRMKIFIVMHRTLLALAVCAAIGVGGVTLAQHIGKGQVKVTQLSERDIIEKLDGKAASAAVVEVTFEPGQKDSPHRHAGPVFGYVLEGEYEHAIDDKPVTTYKAGETFYEPSGSVHRVAQNPSSTTKTRLLVVILHPRDVKEVTVWEKGKE